MSSEQYTTAELDTLLAGALDQRLDDAQMARFEQLLSEPQVAEYYVDHAILHAMLKWEHAQPLDEAIDPPLPELLPPTAVQSAAEHSIPISPVPNILSTAFHGTIGYFSQEIPFSLLIATVVTTLGLLAGSFVYVTHHNQFVTDTSRPSRSPSDRAIAQADIECVGRVTGMADVKWANINTSTERGNGVPLGRKYALTSGLMEITYDTGASVILQGPVTYEVDSRDGGFLSVGKLTARLEKKGKRVASSNPQSLIPNPSLSTIHYPLFTIKTPTATVTDLGTEFGVNVDREGITETEVFVGEISVASADKQWKEGRETMVVRQGHIARVTKETIRLSAADHLESSNRGFVRTMPLPKDSYQVESDAYAALILSLQPAAYYRMERPTYEKDQCVLLDSATKGHHGAIHLGMNTSLLWLEGRFGSALHLRGVMIGDYAVVPEYPQSQTNQLTVAAWVFAENRPPWATIAKNWGNSLLGQFHFGLSEHGEDLHVFLSQADKTRIELREGPASPLPVNVWQHVAVVVDGSMARLYRNGKEVGATPCQGLNYPSPVTGLAIGCKLGDDGIIPDSGNPGYWRGRLDELTIFHHALPPTAIQKLSSTETKTNCGNKATD